MSSESIPRFERPELVFGFVSPIGANLNDVVQSFRSYLATAGYIVEEVKVTDAFKHLREVVEPEEPLQHLRTKERYHSHIAYGNQLRRHFKNNSFLAATSVVRLVRKRLRKRASQPEAYTGIAYLVNQLKRKEEVELLRSIYGDTFFQVSAYSRRAARVDYLAKSFAAGQGSNNVDACRSDAETIVAVDENELLADGKEASHGQQVRQIFHEADFIVNLDEASPSVDAQVVRFCELVFGSNCHSPTHMEYGMFLAKAAALRTLDISRQVGAAIFSNSGEIVTLGSNEVPKAGGGTYWCDEQYDDRDYKRKLDSNEWQKKQILRNTLEKAGLTAPAIDELFEKQTFKNSQLMDALEYGRIVHAEMSAISDAARLGKSVKDSTLYSTTFPCHLCAKHIVASGVARVVFLEPYPKSLASQLHSDSIQVEGADRGQYRSYPAVKFEHFYGVTPRKFNALFSRGKRKDGDGSFVQYARGSRLPIVDVRAPFYSPLEDRILKYVKEQTLAAYDRLESED